MNRAEMVEKVARAIHEAEYGEFVPDAHPDHNRLTWPAVSDAEKQTWRLYGAVAVDTLVKLGAVGVQR